MGKEIYNIINDMAEVLNASQMWQLFGVDTTPQDTIDYWNEQNRSFEFEEANLHEMSILW